MDSISSALATRKATEHTYRAALEQLLNSTGDGVKAVNEPKRQKFGAPDYVVTRARKKQAIDIGYIEAKDIGVSLDKVEKSDQMKRYRTSIGENLILTDYLEFRFFRDGEKIKTIRIAEIEDGIVKASPTKFDSLENHLVEFVEFKGQTIKSAKELAGKMARKAQLMREVFFKAVSNKESDSSLKDQLSAFKKILIHDMDEDQFADVYAQTIAYGLFTARLHDKTLGDFSRAEARDLIPRSNPFLRKLFDYVCGADLDERVVWVVDALCEVYRAANIRDIVADIGETTGRTDPIVHFYETFLGEYDKKLKKKRGVYFTPEPIVHFIVRAIDEVLQTHFGLPDGIADTSKVTIEIDDQAFEPTRKKGQSGAKRVAKKKIDVHRVQLLDVATGTGTFTAEAIKQIHAKMSGQEGLWSQYVEQDLLPRIHGFEILMAPYAMCHLKIEMLLNDLGYKPSNPKNPPRLGVYLTNALEEHHPDADTLFASWLAREANEASRIKRDMPIMVAYGNPPYNVSSQNKGEWIQELIADYKKGLNERKVNLDDDYIKFIRYAEHYIEKTGYGIVAMITNNSFLDGVTHRKMRKHLLETFDHIYVLDLHGSTKKKETAPDGTPDRNVFDIQQGVGIFVLVKNGGKKKGNLAKISTNDLYGSRKKKYDTLWKETVSSKQFTVITPDKEYFFFSSKNFGPSKTYERGIQLSQLFPEYNSGIQSKRDKVTISFSAAEAKSIRKDFTELEVEEIRAKYSLPKDGRDWKIEWAKEDVRINDGAPRLINYRPFDDRYTYYSGKSKGFLAYPRYNTLRHVLKRENILLLFCRQLSIDNYAHIFCTNQITDLNSVSINSKEQTYAAPLYLYDEENGGKRRPNLSPEIVNAIATKLTLRFTPDHDNKKPSDHTQFSPLDLLDYIYAVLHAPSYRETYRELLKIDFPRIPFPKNAEMFWALAALGNEIRSFQLMTHEESGKLITTFPEAGDCVVEKVGKASFKPDGKGESGARMGKVYINKEQYFGGVPEIAWNFVIGGYQPAQKWLKDRIDRALSPDDIRHWQKIIVVLAHTNRLMKEIDAVWRVEKDSRK